MVPHHPFGQYRNPNRQSGILLPYPTSMPSAASQKQEELSEYDYRAARLEGRRRVFEPRLSGACAIDARSGRRHGRHLVPCRRGDAFVPAERRRRPDRGGLAAGCGRYSRQRGVGQSLVAWSEERDGRDARRALEGVLPHGDAVRRVADRHRLERCRVQEGVGAHRRERQVRREHDPVKFRMSREIPVPQIDERRKLQYAAHSCAALECAFADAGDRRKIPVRHAGLV